MLWLAQLYATSNLLEASCTSCKMGKSTIGGFANRTLCISPIFSPISCKHLPWEKNPDCGCHDNMQQQEFKPNRYKSAKWERVQLVVLQRGHYALVLVTGPSTCSYLWPNFLSTSSIKETPELWMSWQKAWRGEFKPDKWCGKIKPSHIWLVTWYESPHSIASYHYYKVKYVMWNTTREICRNFIIHKIRLWLP